MRVLTFIAILFATFTPAVAATNIQVGKEQSAIAEKSHKFGKCFYKNCRER